LKIQKKNIKINLSTEYFWIEFLYFQIRKSKENIHVSEYNIYYFLFLKYLYKKLSFQKIIHLKHITMKKIKKNVIIIVFKPNLKVDPMQDSDHSSWSA
jgi:hypothetical protein